MTRDDLTDYAVCAVILVGTYAAIAAFAGAVLAARELARCILGV